MSAQKFRFVLTGAILLTLAAGAVLGYFGVNYLREQIIAADHLRIEAEINNNAEASISQAERQFDDPRVTRLYDYLQAIVPPPTYREQFVADVTKYAADTKVPLTSLTFLDAAGGQAQAAAAPKIAGAATQVVSLAFGSDMTYDNFIAFVKKLENNLQHIQVLSLSLQPSVSDRAALSSASLTIALYVKQGQQ